MYLSTVLPLLLPLSHALQEPFSDPSSSNGQWEVANCGGEDDILQITTLKVDPETAGVGGPVNVTVKGTLREEVTGGEANFRLLYSSILLLNRRFDLCTEVLGGSTLDCPVKPGPVSFVKEVQIKTSLQGKLTLTLNIWDDEDSKVACIKGSGDFKKK
ncbi:hypothetical protein BJY01DRAFT_252535 [Aspergillus pseudoustus]|uniref:Phosphatidylglycerol/phosphatidylinositol transfer protein n=1 Tax=Aspergillus pseudoustus TaxID=1810923 RepID=A0ABR4J993_9EURO